MILSCSSSKAKESDASEKQNTAADTTVTPKTETTTNKAADTDSSYFEWKEKVLKVTFESNMFEDKITAITWLEENGYTFQETYSPEESKTVVWITVNSSDGKNIAELNYDYYDEEGHFQGFRNIVSEINEIYREDLIKAFTKQAQDETGLTPAKYRKKYGEEGLVWYEENTGQSMQTIVVTKGGTTNWIEIIRCFYFRVTKEEIIK